jgi:hypothetical protein
MELLQTAVSEPILIAIITAIVGPASVATVGILTNNVSKRMQTQSERQFRIGKLRAEREKIMDEYRNDVDDFSIALGSSYARGNDREVVGENVRTIKERRKETRKAAALVSSQILAVYEEEEASNNRKRRRKENNHVPV